MYPVFWRAGPVNSKVLTLEYLTDGTFLVTHMDAGMVTKTLQSAHVTAPGEIAHVRFQRFYDELRIFINGVQSAVRTDLSKVDPVFHTTTPLYLGANTITDGATVGTSCRGTIDEVRLFREEIQDDNRWAFSQYPWFNDERFALYARLDEQIAIGPYKDYSVHENDGSGVGFVHTLADPLVTPLASIMGLHHLRTADGSVERWLIWANAALYGKDVT